jgi:hypothetical protein
MNIVLVLKLITRIMILRIYFIFALKIRSFWFVGFCCDCCYVVRRKSKQREGTLQGVSVAFVYFFTISNRRVVVS